MQKTNYKIIYYPDSILRQKAHEIKDISDPRWGGILDKMTELMHAHKGVGLAGPQIGLSERIIIVETSDGILPLFNPILVSHGKKTYRDEEGCLSIPKTFGIVPRFEEITIKARSKNNTPITFQAHGLFARILQHEIDHTNGVLFIDRVVKFTENPQGFPLPKK